MRCLLTHQLRKFLEKNSGEETGTKESFVWYTNQCAMLPPNLQVFTLEKQRFEAFDELKLILCSAAWQGKDLSWVRFQAMKIKNLKTFQQEVRFQIEVLSEQMQSSSQVFQSLMKFCNLKFFDEMNFELTLNCPGSAARRLGERTWDLLILKLHWSI